jgi:hypothetical protein
MDAAARQLRHRHSATDISYPARQTAEPATITARDVAELAALLRAEATTPDGAKMIAEVTASLLLGRRLWRTAANRRARVKIDPQVRKHLGDTNCGELCSDMNVFAQLLLTKRSSPAYVDVFVGAKQLLECSIDSSGTLGMVFASITLLDQNWFCPEIWVSRQGGRARLRAFQKCRENASKGVTGTLLQPKYWYFPAQTLRLFFGEFDNSGQSGISQRASQFEAT